MREERKREREREREREQENWGSWRDITKGGTEEECVSGERTDEKARTVIQGFFFFSWTFCLIFFRSQFQGLFLLLHNENGGIKTRRKTDSGLCLLALPFFFLASFLL